MLSAKQVITFSLINDLRIQFTLSLTGEFVLGELNKARTVTISELLDMDVTYFPCETNMNHHRSGTEYYIWVISVP